MPILPQAWLMPCSPIMQYWDRQEASVDGVLGGFGHVSDADIDGSRRFLLKVCSGEAARQQCLAGSTCAFNHMSLAQLCPSDDYPCLLHLHSLYVLTRQMTVMPPLVEQVYGPQLKAASDGARPLVALDCGAGIGRVSEQLLLHVFDEVDLVEPSQHLLDAARRRLGSSSKQCVRLPRRSGLGIRSFYSPASRSKIQSSVTEHAGRSRSSTGRSASFRPVSRASRQ